MYPQDFLFIFHGFLCFLVYGSSISHTRRGLGAGVTQVADFDCPEEFGYYPHPTDCTQYYVCVFGGALLESCTGGLMYSHELQTCDWPRNVICGESNGADGGTISTVRVTDPRTRNPPQQSQNLNHIQSVQAVQNQAVQVQIPSGRTPQRQDFNRPLQHEVIQQTLYTDELGPAEEVESDRQQRVYRGQSSVIGSVQRDRDGFRTLKNGNGRSQNGIPTDSTTQDKISVVAFGSQRPSAPRPQEQYSDVTTNTAEYSFDLVLNKSTDNITKKIISRSKRQIVSRHGLHQINAPRIPYVLLPDRSEMRSSSILNYELPARRPLYGNFQSGHKLQVVYPVQMYYHHPLQQQPNIAFLPRQYMNVKLYKNDSAVSPKTSVNEELIKLTKSTIQSEFKPIRSSIPLHDRKVAPDVTVHKTKPGETPINLPSKIITKATPAARIKMKINANKSKTTGHLRQKFITAAGFLRMPTEKPLRPLSATYQDDYRKWYGFSLAKKNVPAANPPISNAVTLPPVSETTKIRLYKIEKPKDYDIRHEEMESEKEKKNTVYNSAILQQNKYFSYSKPQEYEYYEYEEEEEEDEEEEEGIEEKEKKKFSIPKDKSKEKNKTLDEQPVKTEISIHLSSGNISFFDFIEKAGFTDADAVKAAIKTKMPPPAETSTKETNINLNYEAFYVPKGNLNTRPNRFPSYRSQLTTENPRLNTNQIEAPKRKIPEEYYENFKPSPTQSLYLTKLADNDDTDESYERHPVTSYVLPAKRQRVEQVKLTSALPPLSPSPKPSIERYNSSQRFQSGQFDPYYAVYDDVDIYRENDYGQQQFKSPSSTPSSNIVHQYRGSTTYSKQQEAVQEPLQKQQHHNTYTQDIYSPPPVIQDYNDQYNIQIDDQYQQLSQPTLKPSSRSETTNSSKNALTESSVTVALVPENVTAKSESSPISRRSDSSTFFSISSYGPSTILLPPRYHSSTAPNLFDFSTPKSEKPIYSSTSSSYLGERGRNHFEPPKNAGPLAKTLNNFDSLLSSFIATLTNGNRGVPTQGPSTTPPTPKPPKTSPETIVRSEIGRINHQPIVITENFKIRQPSLRKPEESKAENNRPLHSVPSLPLPSSTPVPIQNDYLAYYVEIEPKNHNTEKPPRGYFVKPSLSPETTTEPAIITKDNLRFDQVPQVNFNVGQNNRPFNNFVRVLPNNSNQKVKLGATLDLESIDKPEEKKKDTQNSENDTLEKQTIVGPIPTINRPYQSVGKWVIAKNEFSQKPGRLSSTFRQNPFEAYSQEVQREQITFRDKIEAITEAIRKEKQKEIESVLSRGRGNVVHVQASTEPELPATTVVSGPYKFLYVDLDSTTEHLSTPTPFSRNPENEDRNKYVYKTNPESRVRPKYYVTPAEKEHSDDPAEGSTEAILLNIESIDSDDRIRFNYKTNPESRFRSRYVSSSSIISDDKTVEDVKIIPKITVPLIKSEVQPVTVLKEKPIQVLPVEEEQEHEQEQEQEQEPEQEQEFILPFRKTPEFHPKIVETDTTSEKAYRFEPSTVTAEVETSTEEVKKTLPRRIVKIHRNDLKNQRLRPIKIKKFKKPTTKSPLAVLEELEEKTLSKENEIHPSYRPIIVSDGLDSGKNKTNFRFTLENEKDFDVVPDNKIVPVIVTTEKFILDTVPRGFSSVKPSSVTVATENEVLEKEVPVSDKPLSLFPKRTHILKNVTQLFENRATTKAYRGKFKPSDFKLRLRPTTASPDSESTPGPHLSTRQPQLYTIGSTTGNEISVSRGTSAPNRGTRPTLKPSTAIVSKASDFIDIYRYPPRRPQNLYATPTPDKSAAKCRKDVCLLPDCNCGGKDIPGDYNPEEIPQLVLLTFDDSVNDLNKGLYADLFERGRVNPNGCPISATFYVSHEWTDYSQVQNLYANGHEIASHSITHSFGEQFSQKKWTKEIAGQREILAAYGGVRLEDIRGMRAPFLAVGGNKMFKMLYDSNFTYDSSMPIYENRPPSWPYTLDYKLFHDCMIPPCPTKSYPGVWEVPMVMWQDLNGGRCSMGDACSNPPTAEGVYKMLIKNFERHFTTNRAPFGLYYHAAWFTHEHHKEGFIAFLDTIVNMPEVWLVTTWQAIEWVRNPQPLSTVQNFPPFQCNVEKAKKCNNPKVCNLWHKSGVRYMRTCQPCPDVYPWAGKTGVKNSRVDNEIIEE